MRGVLRRGERPHVKGYLDDGGVFHYTALELQNGRYDYALCEFVERNDGSYAWDYEQTIPGKLKPVTCEEREISCLQCLAVAPAKSTVISRDPHGR